MDNGFRLEIPNIDDLSYKPSYFKTEGEPDSTILMHYVWVQFMVEGEEEPYFYMRKLCMDGSMSWGAVAKLGKTPFEPQQFSYDYLMAQPSNYKNYVPYHEKEGEPGVYETWCEEPYFYHEYDSNGATYKEGDFLDIRATYWPGLIAKKEADFYKGLGASNEKELNRGIDYLYIPIEITGTFNGKKIINGIGQIDRIYFPENKRETMDKIIGPFGYVLGCWCTGYLEDGRKEMFIAHVMQENGRGWAMHWIEGSEPYVVKDGVYLDAKWKHLPYLDESDPTCAYDDCTWYFGGKKAHLHGKWGSRRYTSKPKEEKPGYANVFGEFYVGDKPYKHTIEQTYCEIMTATKENLKKWGHDLEE